MMNGSHKRRLITRLLVLVVLVTSLALFSSGASRRLLNPFNEKEPPALTNRGQAIVNQANGAANQGNNGQLEAATHIEPGVMTERQVQHSKLYDKQYSEPRQLDLAPDPKNRRANEELQAYMGPGLEPVDPRPVEEFMGDLACAADTVIVGTVKSKASQLTESRQFLFTEYDVSVEEVYKDNALAPIARGAEITVVRPGGRVEIGGRIIRTLDASFLPLTIGSRVLLFLKYIPSTGSYDSASRALRKGSFEVSDTNLTALSKDAAPGFPGQKPVPYTPGMRAAISGGCRK